MKECPVCLRCFPDQVNHCPTDGDLLRFYLTGETVLDGRYQLERRLGQGGMGAVFKARHIFLKTQHAIKIILPDLVGNDPTLVTRFRQEAMAAAAIRHPNIIAVTDFGVVSGTTPFLVMEFVEGRSLHDLLGEEQRLSAERALEVMSGIAAGLGAAHRQGIVHRDLKPLNIMLRSDAAGLAESVKLLDFGLAKIKSSDLLGSFVAVQTTGLMGSPFYMAPEQWGDDEPDARADIYSLGIILYQMLAGEVPFRGGSIPSIMSKHLTTPPPSLAGRGISPAVEAVVRHALEKEPVNRPQTVEELVAELREAVLSADAQTARLPDLVSAQQAAPEALDTVSFTEPLTAAPRTTETAASPHAAEEVSAEPRPVGATLFEQSSAAAATMRADELQLQTAAAPLPAANETTVEEAIDEAQKSAPEIPAEPSVADTRTTPEAGQTAFAEILATAPEIGTGRSTPGENAVSAGTTSTGTTNTGAASTGTTNTSATSTDAASAGTTSAGTTSTDATSAGAASIGAASTGAASAGVTSESTAEESVSEQEAQAASDWPAEEDSLNEQTRLSAKTRLKEEMARRLPADEETRLRLSEQLASAGSDVEPRHEANDSEASAMSAGVSAMRAGASGMSAGASVAGQPVRPPVERTRERRLRRRSP